MSEVLVHDGAERLLLGRRLLGIDPAGKSAIGDIELRG